MTREGAIKEINDDVNTMRILFNAVIGDLCNQCRHNDAEEMEGIRDRLIKRLLEKNLKLYRENVELERKLEQTEKDLADYQFNYPTIKELQKENAELKKQVEQKQHLATCEEQQRRSVRISLCRSGLWRHRLWRR